MEEANQYYSLRSTCRICRNGRSAKRSSAAVFKTHRQPDYALFASEDEKQAAKAFDGEKELVVIDEFAPMEISSPAFVPAVEEALASNKGLIISTHAHRGHPLIHRIR